MARTRVAFQCATDARTTINDFYCRNSHFLCFGKNLSQSLREQKNVKFVLNDVKVTAFSGSKRRDIRASILVPLASQSNVTRNAHNDVLLHPDLNVILEQPKRQIFAPNIRAIRDQRHDNKGKQTTSLDGG